ncbi:MAG: hypothetical protein K0R57_2693 [Paenibacillaceae bacterium]|jgi:hypothetical protein|nr:hypothetical protein [Paenibacillaceae bacterium]
MDRKVVIEINFNNFGLNPDRLTHQWLEERIGIFRNLTLRSLKKQTSQNFLAVLKLAGGCTDIVERILATQEPLPPHIQFGTSIESKYRIEQYIQGAQELYIARLDSDDLFHETFVQQLHDYRPQPGTVALVNCHGYLWDTVNGQLAEYYHHSPQFYTFIYRVQDYLDGFRVKLPGRGTHGNVIDLPHEIFTGRNYVNVIHRSNSSIKKIRKPDILPPEATGLVLSHFMTFF